MVSLEGIRRPVLAFRGGPPRPKKTVPGGGGERGLAKREKPTVHHGPDPGRGIGGLRTVNGPLCCPARKKKVARALRGKGLDGGGVDQGHERAGDSCGGQHPGADLMGGGVFGLRVSLGGPAPGSFYVEGLRECQEPQGSGRARTTAQRHGGGGPDTTDENPTPPEKNQDGGPAALLRLGGSEF